MNKFEKNILTYFHIGNIKYAPGTFASFVAALIYFFIPNSLILQFSVLLFHICLGFYFCYIYSLKKNKNEDPGFIVIDEVVGMMISLFLIPKLLSAYLLAFFIFRFLDIFKPSFIFRVQNIGSGVGVMMDDIVSGFITLIIMIGIFN